MNGLAEKLSDVLALLHALPHNYIILLPDAPRFTIAEVTQAYLEATLTERSDIVGKGVFEVFPDNPATPDVKSSEHLSASLYTVLQAKQAHRMAEQRYDVRDQSTGGFAYRVWHPINIPLLDAHGEVQYIIHHAEDVSDSVQLQEQARIAQEVNEQQGQLLYNLFMQAPVAIAIFRGPEHVIELANEAHLQIWGRTAEQVIGKPVFEALPEVKGQGFEALLAGVLTTGNPYYAHELFADLVRNHQLERVYFNFVYQPLRDLDGSISGVIVIANEITEEVVARHEVEAQRRELEVKNRELEHTNRNLEEFAYAASHDLKEPIRKIHLFADRLRTRLIDKLADEERRYFSRMEASAKRMSSLIEDLLVYSHLSRGASVNETVDLNQTLAFVLDDLELLIEETGAHVEADQLPTVNGHHRQLQQLFENLLSNALKYSNPDGAPEVKISCRMVNGKETNELMSAAEAEKRFYFIQIRDNGIGFPQKDAERIFNVFTRLQGTATSRGSGIGLSIAKKVVENHDGFIWAESEPGVGSVFTILLPAA